jgi:hypothetical protein
MHALGGAISPKLSASNWDLNLAIKLAMTCFIFTGDRPGARTACHQVCNPAFSGLGSPLFNKVLPLPFTTCKTKVRLERMDPGLARDPAHRVHRLGWSGVGSKSLQLGPIDKAWNPIGFEFSSELFVALWNLSAEQRQ